MCLKDESYYMEYYGAGPVRLSGFPGTGGKLLVIEKADNLKPYTIYLS